MAPYPEVFVREVGDWRPRQRRSIYRFPREAVVAALEHMAADAEEALPICEPAVWFSERSDEGWIVALVYDEVESEQPPTQVGALLTAPHWRAHPDGHPIPDCAGRWTYEGRGRGELPCEVYRFKGGWNVRWGDGREQSVREVEAGIWRFVPPQPEWEIAP